MKRFTYVLAVLTLAAGCQLLLAFDGSTTGTVRADPNVGSPYFGVMDSSPVDFSVSASDLDLPNLAINGAHVTVKVRVHNLSPNTGVAGGSTLRVLFDGRVVDEVPFYLGAGDSDIEVRARTYLPEGEFKHLQGNDRGAVHVQVVVDPYDRIAETNEGNNTASGEFQVRSDNDYVIKNPAPPMTLDPSGLTAWSSKSDAPNDIINAALPSQALHLKAKIACGVTSDGGDINIKFLVNGLVIFDDNRHMSSRSSPGFAEAETQYIVPYNATDPLDFRVVLSNGQSAGIKIPVLRWDTEVRTGDVYWSGDTVATPGERLFLHAVLKNTSWLSAFHPDAMIACRVLVDGQPFYERDYRVALNELFVTIPGYDVPLDQSGPVTVTIVTDPYDQLAEAGEANNMATIEVPLVAGGSQQPDLWVDAYDLTSIARPLVPGSHVLLSAAIHNGSLHVPPKNVRVRFKINGQVVGEVNRDRSFFHPLRTRLVTYEWIAPLDLAAPVDFEVVIDPFDVITESDESNNSDSTELEIAKPDLTPGQPWFAVVPAAPRAGQPVELRAAVCNCGLTIARDVGVRFLVGGQSIGDASIGAIGPAAAATATLAWTIPQGSDLTTLPWTTLRGESGKLPAQRGLDYDLAIGLVVDPGGQIAEADETNNVAEPARMTVHIPNERNTVYVRLSDVFGPVPGATVILTASNRESAQTLTDDDGWCTFTGVIEGTYTIDVRKDGYHPLTVTGQAGIGGVYTETLAIDDTALDVLTLEPLYPDSAVTPSSIMVGGTMYRYFRVLDARGRTVPSAAIEYSGPFSPDTATASSDEHGEIVFSFAVPAAFAPQRLNSTLTTGQVSVGARVVSLSSTPVFATDVLPLSWSTNWMMGSGLSGKGGLGLGAGVFVAGQEAAGMVLTRTAGDPARSGNGSMSVADSLSAEAAIGAQGQLGGKARLLTVQAQGPNASAQLSLGTFVDFATLFNEPSQCTTMDKLMASLTLLCGVEHCASVGQTTMLSLAQGAIVSALSDEVDFEHLTGGVTAGISAEASLAKLDLLAQRSSSNSPTLGGVSFGTASFGERAVLSITHFPTPGELSGTAALEFEVSVSAVQAFGNDFAGWSDSRAISAEAVVDPLGQGLDRVVLASVSPAGDDGGTQEWSLMLDRAALGQTAGAVLAELSALAPSANPQPNQRIVFSPVFCAQFLGSVAYRLAGVEVPYEHVVTMDEDPTSLSVGIGIEVEGTGIDLAVNPTWGRYQSYPVERGLLAVVDGFDIGRMVKLEEYPASLFAEQVDTLPDVLAELLSAVGDLLSDVWDWVTDQLSSLKDTLLEVGAGAESGAGNTATLLIEKGIDYFAGAGGPGPGGRLVALRPDTAAPPAGSALNLRSLLMTTGVAQEVTLIGTPATPGAFSVGGIYTIEPENATLSAPATLTLRYSAEAAGTRDRAGFSLYHYDPVERVWTPVASSHDQAGRALTAQITEMGAYCVGADTEAPGFSLVMPPGSPATVATATPQLVVGCTETGSGLVPSTFEATIDGSPLEGEWSAANASAVLMVIEPLAAGSHTLAVRGFDGGGNEGSASFVFDVKPPPAQTVLTLSGAFDDRVELRLEAAQVPVEADLASRLMGVPAAYDIWRTGPGPGLAYNLVGSVDAAAGPPNSALFTDLEVVRDATYSYMAIARSAENIEGQPSEPLLVTVAQASETTTSTTTAGGETTTTASENGGGAGETTAGEGRFPRWAWVPIGIGAVIILPGLIALLILKKRRR